MISLVLTLALLQAPAITAPAPPPAVPVVDAAAVEPKPEDTLAGLEQVYSTTCGQTGILYHSYDELCEGIRKQITTYQRKLARDAAKAQQAKAGAKP